MSERDPRTELTPKGFVSFPKLFEKEEFGKGGPKNSVTLLFPQDTDLSKLKAAAKAAVESKWGSKKPRGLNNPFKDGNAVDDNGDPKYPYQGYADRYFIKCSTTNKNNTMGILDKNRAPITDPEEIYGGCKGRAFVFAHAYAGDESKGVTFLLTHFQKLEDCPNEERFGGEHTSASDAFDDELSGKSEASEAFGDDDPFA